MRLGYRSLVGVVPVVSNVVAKSYAGFNNKRRLMNRSSKGFGLTGVAVAVVLMFVTAVFSTSAKSADAPSTLSVQSSVK